LAKGLTRAGKAFAFLFISGYAPNEAMRESIIDPGVAFLQKPFSPAQIIARSTRFSRPNECAQPALSTNTRRIHGTVDLV